MAKRIGWKMAGLSGLMITLVSAVFGRSKNDDGFPDYNRLEYAKPMPAADQQVPQPPPGSIHMEVGNKKQAVRDIPLEEMPVSFRPSQNADSSEPPLDFFDTGAAASSASSAPAVSTTTPPSKP